MTATLDQGFAPSWVLDVIKVGGFPLRVIGRDESEKVEVTEEATEIEATEIDESLLAPPPRFKRMDHAAKMEDVKRKMEQYKQMNRGQ